MNVVTDLFKEYWGYSMSFLTQTAFLILFRVTRAF